MISTEIFAKASEAKKVPACHSCRTHSEWQTQPATKKPLGQKTASRIVKSFGGLGSSSYAPISVIFFDWLKLSETNYFASCCAFHACRFAFVGVLRSYKILAIALIHVRNIFCLGQCFRCSEWQHDQVEGHSKNATERTKCYCS